MADETTMLIDDVRHWQNSKYNERAALIIVACIEGDHSGFDVFYKGEKELFAKMINDLFLKHPDLMIELNSAFNNQKTGGGQ